MDRTRFEYGVFLLNKNVEQVLASQGLEAISLRHTLPNLYELLKQIPEPGVPPSRTDRSIARPDILLGIFFFLFSFDFCIFHRQYQYFQRGGEWVLRTIRINDEGSASIVAKCS